LAAEYRARLEGRAELLGEAPESPCTYHLFPIRVRDRDRVRSSLAERSVATGVHYPRALPEHPPLLRYRTDTPIALDWARRELSLPLFPSMNASELNAVLGALDDLLLPPLVGL
jgi:dTDP-4-amino-4,6-dideoxygalactose transaminase